MNQLIIVWVTFSPYFNKIVFILFTVSKQQKPQLS